MLVAIEHSFWLSNYQFHVQNQPNWKLFQMKGSERVPVEVTTIRGDQRFIVQMDLMPGYYVLSLGTGIRIYEKKLFISPKGEVKWLKGGDKEVA